MQVHLVRSPAILAILLLTSSISAEPSFTGLGHLPGGTNFSAASGISPDGSVVVGFSGAATEAFRWTQATGWSGSATYLGSASQATRIL